VFSRKSMEMGGRRPPPTVIIPPQLSPTKRGATMTKLFLSCAVLFVLVFNAFPAAAASCESLSSLKLPDATITLAQNVAAGAFAPPGGGGRGGGAQFSDLPAFCRVAATLKPTPESDIKIEV